MLKERGVGNTVLKVPQDKPVCYNQNKSKEKTARLMLSDIFILVWCNPFLKVCVDVEERKEKCILYLKVPSLISWHHLVVNESCFRDQSFSYMMVLKLSWYVSESPSDLVQILCSYESWFYRFDGSLENQFLRTFLRRFCFCWWF